MSDKGEGQARYTVHMVGHGHIDPTWLWRWTEGYEEARATFRGALDRMNETPGFIFTASSACFYAWVKACDPALFEEIRARVREGRWEIAGGWWIEPDCNMPCGESFVRQGLYGMRFFEREFGVRVRVGFNPDSFGHAGTFPQIYRKMGVDYYAYQRPEPVRERDYPGGTTFWWEAKDGSRILACNLLEGYNADEETYDRIQRLPRSLHMNAGQTHFLGFFGVGNHGGGPTKRAIQQVLRTQSEVGNTRAIFSTLADYFAQFLATMTDEDIPVATGDLQHHAQGCYTSHAETKRLNRRAEHELMAAERFASAALLVGNHVYPKEALETAWKDLLYNQFHDILAGSSIESSYDDSRDQIGGARHVARAIANESIQVIARSVDTTPEGNTLMVFNPLPWPVRHVVTAPPLIVRALETPIHLVDDEEHIVSLQKVADERIGSDAYVFAAEVPGLGYRCYHACSGVRTTISSRMLEAGRDFIENEWWRIEFHPRHGHIARLFDKQRGIEVMRRGNVLAAIVDSGDTWGHGSVEYRVEAGRFGDAVIDVYDIGDVRGTMRVQSRFGKSFADQFVTLHRDIDTIDCLFRINWQEKYTMLKLAYETNIVEGAATYDTAYGYETRNVSGAEEPGQKWLDLSGCIGATAYGLAVLNDSKYGFDVLNDTMRVSLLRSTAYAHHDPSRYDSSTPFAIMDQGWHRIRTRLVPHAGDWTLGDVVRNAWELNEPAFVHVESAHTGGLPGKASFLSCDASNVALTVLKVAEDGSDLIVRGYETSGRAVRATVSLPFSKADVVADFGANEIKTLRLKRKQGAGEAGESADLGCAEVNLLEEPV